MNAGTKFILAMSILMIGGLVASIIGDYLVGNRVDGLTIVNYTRAIDAKIIEIWRMITESIKGFLKS